MLDPLTAISLASAVVQFTDFGIKLVKGSIELYQSADGLGVERSNVEVRVTHIRKLADKIILSLEQDVDDGRASEDEKELSKLAIMCRDMALDFLKVLDDLKVKKPAGPGRKWESLKKAVAAQTPHNKKKVEDLDRSLRYLRGEMLSRIQIMMRYTSLQCWQSTSNLRSLAHNNLRSC